MAKIKGGVVAGLSAPSGSSAHTIQFNHTFANAPTVTVSPRHDTATFVATVINVGKTDFIVRISNSGSLTYTINLDWIAVDYS